MIRLTSIYRKFLFESFVKFSSRLSAGAATWQQKPVQFLLHLLLKSQLRFAAANAADESNDDDQGCGEGRDPITTSGVISHHAT